MHPHVHYIPEGTVIRWTEAIKTGIRLQHEDEATRFQSSSIALLVLIFLLQVYLIIFLSSQLSSIQFSHSLVSDSLRPHGLQHARPPCPSPTPRVYPNSCQLSP